MPGTRTASAVAGLITALVLLVLGAAPASAHDIVESSDPAEGASLAAPPARVSVTLDEAPQGQLSVLTVVGPDGRHYEQGATTTADTVVSVGVSPLGPAGAYEIGYRIVSSDGHPIIGAIGFTLTAPGPGAATPPAAQAAGPTPAGEPVAAQPSAAAGSGAASAEDEGGLPAWPFVVLAVVVVGGAVALVLRRRA